MIQVAGHGDVADAVAIAERVYPAFDARQAVDWLRSIIGKPNVAFLRDGDSFIIASITQSFWSPPRCYLLFVFGKPHPGRIWEVCRLMKAVDAWRKHLGAEGFYFGEDTGVDLGPIAKRLGAKMARPSWQLEGGHRQAPPLSPVLAMAMAGGGRLSALEQAMRIA